MTTPTYTPLDIVNFAANKDAVNIQTAFDQMIGQKVYDAIQQRKIEIAQSMFSDPSAEVEQDDDQEQEREGEEDVVAGEHKENQEPEESHEDAEQHA